MRCYICDKDDDLIYFDKVLGEYSPCTVCQAIIEETLEEFEEPYEDFTSVDYSERGRGDRLHSEGVQPEREARRPFCETYNVSPKS
jgi:hypothetical protein